MLGDVGEFVAPGALGFFGLFDSSLGDLEEQLPDDQEPARSAGSNSR